MSHYQKTAVLLVRFAAMVALVLGIVGSFYGAVAGARGARLTAEQAERVAGSYWYVGLGVVLFLGSRPLGRLLGRGLE